MTSAWFFHYMLVLSLPFHAGSVRVGRGLHLQGHEPGPSAWQLGPGAPIAIAILRRRKIAIAIGAPGPRRALYHWTTDAAYGYYLGPNKSFLSLSISLYIYLSLYLYGSVSLPLSLSLCLSLSPSLSLSISLLSFSRSLSLAISMSPYFSHSRAQTWMSRRVFWNSWAQCFIFSYYVWLEDSGRRRFQCH